MKDLLSRIVSLAAVVLLCGCAIQKVTLQPDMKRKIRTIAIAEVPEPDQYFFMPRPNPAGAALYAFGAIGGAILGGIEGSRAETATKELQESLKNHPPLVGAHLTSELAATLRARGYTITQVPAFKRQPENEPVDCGAVSGTADAVLLASLFAGFADGSPVEPRVNVRLRLLSGDCKQVVHFDVYSYRNAQLTNETVILRTEDATFPDRGSLLSSPPRIGEVLRSGAGKVAARIAQDL